MAGEMWHRMRDLIESSRGMAVSVLVVAIGAIATGIVMPTDAWQFSDGGWVR